MLAENAPAGDHSDTKLYNSPRRQQTPLTCRPQDANVARMGYVATQTVLRIPGGGIMGKLILSMLIGMTVMLVTTDDSKGSLRETVRAAALAVAEAVHK